MKTLARYSLLVIPSILAYGLYFWVNRVTPWIGGYPFFPVWIISCLILTWVFLGIFYFLDQNKVDDPSPSLLTDHNLADIQAPQDRS